MKTWCSRGELNTRRRGKRNVVICVLTVAVKRGACSTCDEVGNTFIRTTKGREGSLEDLSVGGNKLNIGSDVGCCVSVERGNS